MYLNIYHAIIPYFVIMISSIRRIVAKALKSRLLGKDKPIFTRLVENIPNQRMVCGIAFSNH